MSKHVVELNLKHFISLTKPQNAGDEYADLQGLKQGLKQGIARTNPRNAGD